MLCFDVFRTSEFYKCFVLAFPEPRFSVSANGVSRSGVRNHATALAVVRTAPRLCPMNRPDTVYFTRSLPPTARCRQAFVGCRSELADRRNRPAWQRRGSGQSPISRTARRHWWLTRSGLFPPQVVAIYGIVLCLADGNGQTRCALPNMPTALLR